MKRNLKLAAYVTGLVMSVAYIMNPGAGVFELLPDALPIVGNLDEAGMTALFLACMRAMRAHRVETKLLAEAPPEPAA
jgi:uncharacterized membrane protein YkvA (DUF1232 family)